jgi:hypothetical protein
VHQIVCFDLTNLFFAILLFYIKITTSVRFSAGKGERSTFAASRDGYLGRVSGAFRRVCGGNFQRSFEVDHTFIFAEIFPLFKYYSSLSTSLNSMSAVVLEDFYKPFFGSPLTDRQANILMKTVVIFMGLLCLGIAKRIVRKLLQFLYNFSSSFRRRKNGNGPTIDDDF